MGPGRLAASCDFIEGFSGICRHQLKHKAASRAGCVRGCLSYVVMRGRSFKEARQEATAKRR